jgi:hypothetical protein
MLLDISAAYPKSFLFVAKAKIYPRKFWKIRQRVGVIIPGFNPLVAKTWFPRTSTMGILYAVDYHFRCSV